MNFGYSTSFKTLDKGLIEQFGPSGFAASLFHVSFNLTALQSGFIYHTVFLFIFGLGLQSFVYLLISLNLLFSVFNTQFFLVLFGFFLLILSE